MEHFCSNEKGMKKVLVCTISISFDMATETIWMIINKMTYKKFKLGVPFKVFDESRWVLQWKSFYILWLWNKLLIRLYIWDYLGNLTQAIQIKIFSSLRLIYQILSNSKLRGKDAEK